MSNEPTVAQEIASALARHGVEILFAQSLPSMVALSAEDLRHPPVRLSHRECRRGDGRRLCARLRQGRRGDGAERPGGDAAGAGPCRGAEVLDPRGGAGAGRQPSAGRPQRLPGARSYRPVPAGVEMGAAGDRSRPRDRLSRHGLRGSRRRASRARRCCCCRPMCCWNACNRRRRGRPASARYPLDRADRRSGPHRTRPPTSSPMPSTRWSSRAAACICRMPRARSPLLQAAAHLPVMTTVMGKGAVDETHPLSLGVAGYNLGRLAPGRYLRPLIERADVVLLIGTRTNQNGTDSWALYPDGAKYIHIDVDPAEIGRNYEALRLMGDAKLTLAALTEKLRGRRQPAPRGRAGDRRRARQARRRDRAADALGCEPGASGADDGRPAAGADPRDDHGGGCELLHGLGRLLSQGAAPRHALHHAARARRPRLGTAARDRRQHGGSPTSRSSALPATAALRMSGRSSRPRTACKAKIVLTVLNNGVLAYQKDAEDVKFGRHSSAVRFAPVDHAQIARACGCRGVRVEQAVRLSAGVARGARRERDHRDRCDHRSGSLSADHLFRRDARSRARRRACMRADRRHNAHAHPVRNPRRRDDRHAQPA